MRDVEAEVIVRLTVLAEGPALPPEDRAAVRYVLHRFIEDRKARARAARDEEATKPIATTAAGKLAARGCR
jgi:hypothetical protein